MTVNVRFAPSPTGHIHIGNARTALFNWLFALKNSGRFIQRFDDTDIGRSRQEYADAILYDLHWLGIFQDATEYQSRRFDSYEAAVEQLEESGRALCLLRNARGTRPEAQDPPHARPAAGLRPRGAGAHPCADRRIPVRRPQAALALPAAELLRRSARNRTHRSHLDRPRARRGNRRSGVAVRSGAGARGRHLPLYAAFGRGRHRNGHQPRHPRRRPCHQHRRADSAVQGAWRRAAGLRPSQSADHGLGRGAVEAQRRAFDRQPARIRHRADGGGLARRAGRHIGECRRGSDTMPELARALRPRRDVQIGGEIRSGRI